MFGFATIEIASAVPLSFHANRFIRALSLAENRTNRVLAGCHFATMLLLAVNVGGLLPRTALKKGRKVLESMHIA